MSSTSVVLHYYLKELRRVLHGPRAVLAFLSAIAMHAVGHALVALVASALALSLAARWGAHGELTVGRGLPWRVYGDGAAASNKAFFFSSVGFAVVFVKSAAGIYATYVQGWVAGKVGCSLRLEVLEALFARHRMSQPRHPDQGSTPASATVVTLTERIREVETGLSRGVLGGVRALAQLLPIGVLLVVLSPRIAAVAALALGTFGWGLGRARAAYRVAVTRAAEQHERLLLAADDAARHADLWVTYGAEPRVRASLRRLGEHLSVGSATLEARAATLSGANEILAAGALVAAMAASRAGWLGAFADGPTVLSFVLAFFLAYRPLRDLSESRLALARAQVAFDEVAAILGGPPGADEATAPLGRPPREARSQPWGAGVLELRGLRLPRGRSGPISARIGAGEIAVVVGPTGVGKTTLLRTLLGLERSLEGDVVFGGVGLGNAPAGPCDRPFAWVPQDAPLLADTLAVNVALGADHADLQRALEPLGAARLVTALGEARLGQAGRAVSGGERQWIALARAMATGQPVLLLDEPTNGLDPDAQSVVLEAVARLRGKRTVILVTHRAKPLAIADVIIRLDGAQAETRAVC